MERNYIQKRILNNAIRSDVGLKRTIGWSDKRKTAILGVMEKQGIKTDINKLAGYKKGAFLKEVMKTTDIGYDTRKAFQSAYGEKKVEAPKQVVKKETASSMKKIYGEIISKNSNRPKPYGIINDLPKNDLRLSNFGASDKGLRQANDLFVKPKQSFNPLYDSAQENLDSKEALKKRLGNIQN